MTEALAIERRRFLEPEEWKKAARAAQAAAAAEGKTLNPRDLDPLYKRMPVFEVKEPDDVEEERVLRFSITTADVDRDRDTINVDGWDLTNYRMNPVVLFVHDYKQLPVAQSLREWTEDGKVKSDAQFVDKDTYPFGYTVYQMYKLKFMRAVSVGFLPTKWSFVEEDDRPFGVDFEEQELLEYSAVPVPSNPYALEEAAKKGIDTEPLREWAYDVLGRDPSGLWVPKAAIEEMKRVLDGEHKQFNFPTAKLAEDETLPLASPEETPGDATEPAEGEPKGETGTPAEPAEGDTEQQGAPSPMQETHAARLIQMLAVLRARALGVELSVEPEHSLLNTRLPSNRLERQANFLAARMLPELDAETFERLFPECLGQGCVVARTDSQGRAYTSETVLSELRSIREGLDGWVRRSEELLEAEEAGSTTTEDAGDLPAEDPLVLDFLEPIIEGEGQGASEEAEEYDPLADLGLGADPEEVARE